MVNAGHNLAYFWANFSYMVAITTLTAAYMIPSGDVTHAAARLLLSNSLRGLGRAGTLVVVTIINRQVRVIMTAFGIIELSYSNLIMVLRNAYSFGAVMY